MKKIFLVVLSMLLISIFTSHVSALENKFTGYWRTRAFTQQNFTGEDNTEAQDLTQVDTRTRFYYTAIINENLKLVNQFELDAVWGDSTTYGDIGADNVSVEVKNTHADFNIANFNFKIGTQEWLLHRGFLFNADFSGLRITYKADNFNIPFIWTKVNEGGAGKDANDDDFDYYTIAPSITINETMMVSPSIMWATRESTDTDLFFVGVDFDANFDNAKIWFTGIYEGGKIDEEIDSNAWFAAIGGDAIFKMAKINAQIFYASGDDDYDDERNTFMVPVKKGQKYHWAEIMGLGIFDNQASNNSPADKISNIIAYNLGVTFKPIAKMSLSSNLWYAELADMPGNADEDLGLEIDLKLTYKLIDGLNLDIIAAYLFAGDATETTPDEANPFEIGTRLCFKF